MTRKIFLLFSLLTVALMSRAQQLVVHREQVATVHALGNDIANINGNTITIGGINYDVTHIDSICTSHTAATANTVVVNYNGNTASVTIPAEIVPQLTIHTDGAHVSIVQSEDVTDELNYVLQGNATDGSFWMDGKYKATLTLNGLDLTCADSAAINIRDGKRISLVLTDGTDNVLADGAKGTQKGCFMVKGHTEVKGSGSLTLTGNAAHAFWGGEYLELKKTAGSITVTSAAKDAFNINQYFAMKGGTINVKACGDDGIQVSVTDDATDEQNGQVIISGGSLSIMATAAGAKGLKCADSLLVSGGTIDITTTGAGYYDSEELDVKGAAAIKVGGSAVIDGGTITVKSTGKGGKGINCDGTFTVNDGTLQVTTTGSQYTYSRLSSSPKGIRAEGNLYVNGGTLTIACTGGEGSEGLESKSEIHITGGDIIATTYDDALNASSKIDISGGRIYAVATNNDGIDSNGTLYISGGLVISSGANQPEEGFDCDNNTFSITGGTLIGMGGSSSTPTSSVCTQAVSVLGGLSLTQGQQLALTDADGNAIWSLTLPRTYSQATVLVSSPQISVGSTYTLTTGAAATGGTSWQGYTDDATISGGTTLKSFTQSSTVVSSGSTGGGPSGGGPGGGGGRPW